MTIHYHGTPITPLARLYEMAGRHFCVSFAARNQDRRCHELGQSVMLDNGAFSYWRAGWRYGVDDWMGFYLWVEPWLDHQTTWAVIPDVIGGSEEENDLLLAKWHQRRLPRGAPVWHMHESLERLKRLSVGYERVCIGSSGEYATVGTDKWHWRMIEAMNDLCGNGPPPCWLHMLRGMDVVDAGYPFASVDSTDIAQNHNRAQNTVPQMVNRWDALQAPARWTIKPVQEELVALEDVE